MLLSKLIKVNKYELILEAYKNYAVSEDVTVTLTLGLLKANTEKFLKCNQYFVLSAPCAVNGFEVQGIVQFSHEYNYFRCQNFPDTLSAWYLKEVGLGMDANQENEKTELVNEIISNTKNLAPFMRVDLLTVERKRYLLKKKIGQQSLADLLNMEFQGEEVLNLWQRIELCLHLAQAVSLVHSENKVICRLTPESIRLDLSTDPMTVVICNYEHCTSKGNLKLFNEHNEFLAPQCTIANKAVFVQPAIDVFALGRIFWMIWGNDSFKTRADLSKERFVKLHDLQEKYRNKIYTLLETMCLLGGCERAKLETVELQLKFAIAHHKPTVFKRFHPAVTDEGLSPVYFFSKISKTHPPRKLNEDLVSAMIMQALSYVESNIKLKLEKLRARVSQIRTVPGLVCWQMHSDKVMFHANDLLCQFMKVAKDNGVLQDVCEDLLIDEVNPELLVFENSKSLVYINWRAGIFGLFNRANQERQKFFTDIKTYLYIKNVTLDFSRSTEICPLDNSSTLSKI